MEIQSLEPSKKYDIILADPPWPHWGEQAKWGAAAKFYDTMKISEIYKMPVPYLLNSRSIVFLWTTSSQLENAMTCFNFWRLTYRGIAFVWIKTKKDGTPIKGQGVRPSITKPLTEFVIVGSTIERGRPLPLSDESIQQTIFTSKREHSRKPDEVMDYIDRMYPEASKLELFSRQTRPGWDCWGKECGKYDRGEENGQ